MLGVFADDALARLTASAELLQCALAASTENLNAWCGGSIRGLETVGNLLYVMLQCREYVARRARERGLARSVSVAR